MLKDLQDLLLIKLQSGINQMKEESGIVFKQFDVDHGKIDQGKIEIVPIVQKSFLRWSEEEELIKGSVIPTAKHLIIEKIKHLKETEDVYDIEVVDAHHFSLANGAIVHNSHFSDAFRYLVLSLSRTRDGQSSAQDLDNRYREACGGQDSSMPNFFRDNGSRY